MADGDDQAGTATGGSVEDRLQRFFRRIAEKIEDAANLTIVTAIGDPVFDGQRLDMSRLTGAKMMCTEINLVDGHIRTVLNRDFIDGDLKELRDLHQRREEQGGLIVKQNLEALRELVSLIGHLRRESTATPAQG